MLKKLKLILLVAILFMGCSEGHEKSNGDLDKEFGKENPELMTSEQKYEIEKQKLIADGWQEETIQNGVLPSCYNFRPQKSDIDNYLQVKVGGGTDVAIKVMKINSDKCVRYVFINSGTTYTIRNIPQGQYYLKIAYGKNWISKVENNQCIGKFLRNPIYEKGNDTLDFNLKHTFDGYSVPSFSLNLDVVSNSISNSFSSQNISEDFFNQ